MKPYRVIIACKPVINGKAGNNNGPVSLVLRQYTTGTAISKKPGDIFQRADVGIVDDGVKIVKMKSVVKMIGVNEQGNQHQYTNAGT